MRSFLPNAPCCSCRPRYKYETSVSHNILVNSSESALPCHSNHSLHEAEMTTLDDQSGAQQTPYNCELLLAASSHSHSFSHPLACEKEAGSSLWIYVFLGNMLRGVGETPIMPLGVSYLDDFSREENTPFYLGLLAYLLSFLNI